MSVEENLRGVQRGFFGGDDFPALELEKVAGHVSVGVREREEGKSAREVLAGSGQELICSLNLLRCIFPVYDCRK